MLAALALGAEGVTLGTRLLLTRECPIHENLKQALMQATELDTLPILGSLHNTLRAWKNAAAIRVAKLEAESADPMEILSVVAGIATKQMLSNGDVDAGVLACGQAVGLIDQVEPVADVITRMVTQAVEIADRIARKGTLYGDIHQTQSSI